MSTDHDSTGKRPIPTSRWRRLLRFTLVAILVLLAVRLVAGYAARVQLKQATQRVAASGDSLRFRDFSPPDVTVGDNATDFLEAAGQLLAAEQATSEGAALVNVLSERLREIDRQRLTPSSEDLALARHAVDSYDLVLRVLDEGMSRERARFDVNYFSRAPATLDIPNLVRRLRLTNLLRARAWLAVDSDRPDDAWRDVGRIFRLAGWLAEEMPTVVHAMIAQAVARQGLATARGVLQSAPPSNEQMTLVLSQARRWDPRAIHARVLRAERAAMFTTLLDEGSWHNLARGIRPARLNLGPWPLDVYYGDILTSWPLRPWITWNVVAYTDSMSRLIEACEPTAHQWPAAAQGRLAWHFSPPRWAILARRALPNLLESCVKRDLLVADFDLMTLAFRLEEHRRQTGSYPPALDLLGQVPSPDPFSGEPYRYRLEGDGAVVYSVAGNRADDGGVPGVVEPAHGVTKSIPELDSGDLVWRLRARGVVADGRDSTARANG